MLGIWWGLAVTLMFLAVFGVVFGLAWFKLFNAYALPKSILFYAHVAGVPLLSSGFVNIGFGWEDFKIGENPQLQIKEGGVNTATPNLYLISIGAAVLLASYLIAGWVYTQERKAELT